MSAEKKRKTPELNQTVKLGIRTGLFLFCPKQTFDARIDRAKAPLSTVPIRSFQVFFLCLLDGDATEKQTVEINRTTYCRSLIPDCLLLNLSTTFLALPCLGRYASPLCFSRAAERQKEKHNRRKEK